MAVRKAVVKKKKDRTSKDIRRTRVAKTSIGKKTKRVAVKRPRAVRGGVGPGALNKALRIARKVPLERHEDEYARLRGRMDLRDRQLAIYARGFESEEARADYLKQMLANLRLLRTSVSVAAVRARRQGIFWAAKKKGGRKRSPVPGHLGYLGMVDADLRSVRKELRALGVDVAEHEKRLEQREKGVG